MGPIYQFSQEQEKLLLKYLDTMMNERKIRPSRSTVGSWYDLYQNLMDTAYGFVLILDI